VREKYPELNILYLPFDTPGNMDFWVGRLQPRSVLFARYEYWPNLLDQLKKRGIPYVFFSSVFRPATSLFRPSLRFLLRLVLQAKVIFVQDERSERLLERFRGVHVVQAGDTRVDRVWENIQKGCRDQVILDWASVDKVIILGSVHKEDIGIVRTCVKWAETNNWKVLLAPHEVDGVSVNWWSQQLDPTPCGKWSEHESAFRVLILDTIGQLANAYSIGEMAYIGGGFGKSIHNTLEPAAAGIPISFGPRHERFVEADLLIESGAAFPITTDFDLKTWLGQMQNETDRKNASNAARKFIDRQRGAAERIITYLASEKIFE